MARNGSGVYSLPAGSVVVNGDTSDATDVNTPIADIAADLNVARPIVAGGTGATSASAARTALGLAIGTNVQAYDAALTSVAALGTAANKGIYFTGVDTAAEFDLTTQGRQLLDDTSFADMRTTLGLGSTATRDIDNTRDLTVNPDDVMSRGALKTALGATTTIDPDTLSAVEFTGIPDFGCSEIDIFMDCDTSASAVLEVQLSTGTSFVTTGYEATRIQLGATTQNITTSTTCHQGATGSDARQGWISFRKDPDSNTWHGQSQSRTSGTLFYISTSRLAMAGVLDGVRVQMASGTFGPGAISIRYR